MPRGSHHHGHVEQRDLYDDLGVAEGATETEIRRAYRELILKVHPDKQGDAAEFRKVHEAYEVLRDPAKRQQYDTRHALDDDDDWEDQYSDGSDDDFDYYYQEARSYSAWADFVREAQARARANDRSGGSRFNGYETDEGQEWRAFVEREARERAEWKKAEQKQYMAAAEIRQARVEYEKKLEMEREETVRDNAIAQEDRLHEKVARSNKKTKQAASRKNCTCQGCRDRFIREQNEKDQKKKDPKGYAERMAIREAVAARKQKEAAEQARKDEERQAEEQRAAEEAAAKRKIAQEKATAEQAIQDRLHQQLAEQEARQKEKEQAAAEDIADRRRREQLAKREAKEAAERQANEARDAAERKSKTASELKARKAAERAAAEEAHRLAEQEARDATRREAAERGVNETAARKAREGEEKRLDEAAQREAKEAAERKKKDAAERKTKQAAERKAKAVADREAKEKLEREAREAAALRAKEEADQEANDSAARNAQAEERIAQEAEEIDFGEAEERAAVEQEPQERARREAANRKAEDLARGAREITQRLNAARRVEEMAKQEARDASKREATEPERGVKATAEQETSADPPIGPYTIRAPPLQAEGGRRAKIPCKNGQRCKFLAAGTCTFLHQDDPVVNSASVGSNHKPPHPAEQRSTVIAKVKYNENTARSSQAEGDRRSKTRCRLGKNCKYLLKGTCIYLHTEDQLANAAVVGQSGSRNASLDSTKSESTPSDPTDNLKSSDAKMHKLERPIPESTDWQVASKATETANQDTSNTATRVPMEPAKQIVQRDAALSPPVIPVTTGFPKNLSQAARLKIANSYIQTTKDGVILKLLEEDKHVPAEGIAVDLGWTTAGPAFVCFFCKFKKLKYSFRCPQGNAVACGRCKKSLSTVTPEDEAILISAE